MSNATVVIFVIAILIVAALAWRTSSAGDPASRHVSRTNRDDQVGWHAHSRRRAERLRLRRKNHPGRRTK